MGAFVYVREPTTYIYDSYHKATTLKIEYDASPLKYMIHMMPWCTLGDPLPLTFMVYGSWSLKIVDIYYENDLTLIEFCFSRKGVK
jgi:hypothetical protein